MLVKNILFTLCIITFLSCDKKEVTKVETTAIDTLNNPVANVHDPIIKLHPKASKMVENWGEYQKLDEFMQQYLSISTNDALFNAVELSELSQQLKDSIRVEKLDIPSVRIRLNVLYNETLRLADMSTIGKITEAEIIQENKNILEAYSALHVKINNMIHQENLNKDVNEFIEEITQDDSVISKKIIKPIPLKKNKIK